MYVNQIDNIIDKILDKLYLDGISRDPTFKSIVDGKKINYVEYRENINDFLANFMKTIDVNPIKQLINDEANLIRILDIIKRYVAYYYFLSLAFYYVGTIKEFRNNLIQYSKLQENSTFTIRNFFDTENNYQIIHFYQIIKDVSNIITMTELQKKTLNPLQIKDAIDFLNNLGRDFIDNYLLTITGDQNIEINTHNLIKTIVFREIYRNQEQSLVFEILNEVEENEYDHIYIDIVVTSDDASDYENFRQMFLGVKHGETIAKDLFELVNESNKISSLQTLDVKNNNLLKFSMITPIVDDFLRYHRDSEKLEIDGDKPFIMPLTNNNNAKNVQLALLYQQRKKKENTKAQLIANKIDAISDYYSENVRNNPTIENNIKKYFQNPLSYRKAVMHNYLEEVNVMTKILNQGRRVVQGNEYFLELQHAVNNAYFNFKDFKKYGTSINFNAETPINMIRYSNIENQNQMPQLEIDMHTAINDNIINLVGFAIGPLEDGPIQCVKKENLVDIRTIKFNYIRDGEVTISQSDNGFDLFLQLIKYLYIDTIKVTVKPSFKIYNDFNQVIKLNPLLANKVIYWIYDIEKDHFEMETYEALKSQNFQETIKFMNGIIYDKIMSYLWRKLIQLINEHKDLPTSKIELLIELYSNVNRLFIKQDEKQQLIIQEYLQNKTTAISNIVPVTNLDSIELPEFKAVPNLSVFRIKIDTINPQHPQRYINMSLTGYNDDNDKDISLFEGKCAHQNEWNDIAKIKNDNINVYNERITQFIEKFAIETSELQFVCRVCGQVLPLTQYIQDGSFDNNTQKFVTAYVPINIPLKEIKEYAKYPITIQYLDTLINRISLITGTNMLVGNTTTISQKRKALVKNIIDLVVKHNSINSRKNNDERLDIVSKKYNIDKDLDSVYFFELDDEIFNFVPSASDLNVDINRLKFNNILLYFILIFITELNGAQITMMNSDKIGNIYVFLKWGPKLFGNLLIKKNINGTETEPIVKYPVLCYLIFLIAYYLIKYKIWYYQSSGAKVFDPFYSKIIINSLVDLFNSIMTDAGKMPNDYIYLLTSSKLYSHFSDTFKNNEIINVLKRNHAKYADKSAVVDTVPIVPEQDMPNKIIYYIKDSYKLPSTTGPIKLPNYKISSGVQFDNANNLVYPATYAITDITNCPKGSYHDWQAVGKDIVCKICGEKGDQVTGDKNRAIETYYFNLNVIANRRCLTGLLHDFAGKNSCKLCNKNANETYSTADLDILAENLDKLENKNIQRTLDIISKKRDREIINDKLSKKTIQNLVDNYRKETGDKVYGQINMQINNLMSIMETYIGININLDIDKYPVYLIDNVYIIDHSYNGSLFDEPIILTETDNRILFREKHVFFKTDVYYYTDKQTQIDVFYHAVTLKLLGYKEKHKDYVKQNINVYLKINYSIKNRLLVIGYEMRYIDIGGIFIKNSKIIKDSNENYHQILDNLIKGHILKTKLIIDKIESIIHKIRNYQPTQDNESARYMPPAAQVIEKLVIKYANILTSLNLGEAFVEWNELRDSFMYKQINWSETNTMPPDLDPITNTMYVNTDLINHYDLSSNLMMYYLIHQLTLILELNNNKISKINISQMYAEIITYIYDLYNMTKYKNLMELKRFDYILNGSDVMVDIFKKGQGLTQAKEIDDNRPDFIDVIDVIDVNESIGEGEQEDIREDLREEADALDIEGDYFAEEDEDYAQTDDQTD